MSEMVMHSFRKYAVVSALATVSALGFAGSALADGPWNWSGAYVGIHAGGGWSRR